MEHPSKTGRPNIPIHAGGILSPKTLRRIIEAAGLTTDEFRKLV